MVSFTALCELLKCSEDPRGRTWFFSNFSANGGRVVILEHKCCCTGPGYFSLPYRVLHFLLFFFTAGTPWNASCRDWMIFRQIYQAKKHRQLSQTKSVLFFLIYGEGYNYASQNQLSYFCVSFIAHQGTFYFNSSTYAGLTLLGLQGRNNEGPFISVLLPENLRTCFEPSV